MVESGNGVVRPLAPGGTCCSFGQTLDLDVRTFYRRACIHKSEEAEEYGYGYGYGYILGPSPVPPIYLCG